MILLQVVLSRRKLFALVSCQFWSGFEWFFVLIFLSAFIVQLAKEEILKKYWKQFSLGRHLVKTLKKNHTTNKCWKNNIKSKLKWVEDRFVYVLQKNNGLIPNNSQMVQ